MDDVPPVDGIAQGEGLRAASPMTLALAAARAAGEQGEVPVGAVITALDGRILATAHNRMGRDRDATAHAELLCMRQAAQLSASGRLENCDLWVTLEPCTMCAAAASLFRIRRICFGAYDPKGGGVDHGPRVFQTMPNAFRPEIVGGVQERESRKLLQTFFQNLR